MISLGLPWVMALLPLPWFVWRFVRPYHDHVPAVRIPFFRQIIRAADLEPRAGAVILRRTRFQMLVAVVVWVLIVLSLARPEQLGEPVIVEKSARDIVLALDISGSMDEHDFFDENGNRMQRLETVKNVLDEFIQARDGDRMALIVFGTRAFVQAPFTEDLASLTEFLDQTIVGMAGPNTAIGDSIGLAIRTFEASEVDQRLMILLSDGADTSSRMTPINAADIAREKGVSIYTIGVGDPVASGEGRVDLGTLQVIAQRTGGAFFFAGDAAALTEVYGRIDAQNPREVEITSFTPARDLGFVPLLAAVLIAFGSIAVLHFRQQRAGRSNA